jgi:large subunit ribosomal protein L4
MATEAKTPAKATKPTLAKDIFAVEVNNHELLKLAYDSYLAEGRLSSATTKRRGEVRGGGKKPWKQKGTGRARFGSSRNPIWRGGGVVFGPLGIENYKKKLPTASKRVALRQALTLANKEGKLTIVDTFATPTGRTKETIAFLKANGAADTRRVLVVVSEKDDMTRRATNNVQSVLVSQANYLNVYNILNADKILMSQKALEMVTTWLKKETK